MPRNAQRPVSYIDDASWDPHKSDEEIEDSWSEEVYDSYCEETGDSGGDDSIVVPDHVVEYAETASPRTPSESSAQSS
ncbi:hypothetical protein CEP52_017616, partial [Fusarium oligoseptatum]